MSSPAAPAHLKGVTLPDGADVDQLRRRYGTDRSRVGVVLIAALLIVPFLAWVVWAGLEQANREIRWETVGFSAASNDSVTINFHVFRPEGSPAECTVRALDLHGVEVGRAQVPISPDGQDATVDYPLAVTARPSSAFVDSCRLTD